jgi:hypothetical protein
MLSASLAVSGLPGRHRVLFVGSRRDAATAGACGLHVDASVCPPRSRPSAGAAEVRSLLRDFAPDLVHAWGAAAGRRCAAAGLGRRLIVTLAEAPGPRTTAALGSMKGARIAAIGEAVAARLRGGGIDAAVLPPALVADAGEAAAAADRSALRAEWGIDEPSLVVGLFGDPVGAADAAVAAKAVVRLALAGRQAVAIVHPAAARRADASAWVRSMGRADALRQEPRMGLAWSVAAGLDVAVVAGAAGPGATAPALVRLAAAGVPVVAVDDAVSREALDEGRCGMLTDATDRTNAVTAALLRLHDRPVERGRRGAEASRHVVERWPPGACLDRLDELYAAAGRAPVG